MIKRKIAALGAAGAIALAAIGCGAADTPATPADGQPPQQQQPQPGGGPPDMSGLATALGVSASELQAAMEKLRGSGSPDDMAASLAKELGLSMAKVQEALESSRPEGSPPGAGSRPPPTRPAPDRFARFAPAAIRRRGGEATLRQAAGNARRRPSAT